MASEPTPDLPAPRVQRMDENTTLIECGFVHEDGYRIVVEWDGEEWAATAIGLKPNLGGAYGHGKTQMTALASLACSLAATADCIAESPAPASPVPSVLEKRITEIGAAIDDHERNCGEWGVDVGDDMPDLRRLVASLAADVRSALSTEAEPSEETEIGSLRAALADLARLAPPPIAGRNDYAHALEVARALSSSPSTTEPTRGG